MWQSSLLTDTENVLLQIDFFLHCFSHILVDCFTNNSELFQIVLYEIKATSFGYRNQSNGRRRRQQNIDKPERCQDPSQHTRFFHCTKCRWSETVMISMPCECQTFCWNDVLCSAWFYCKACHDDIKDETLIKKCKCKNCKYIGFRISHSISLNKTENVWDEKKNAAHDRRHRIDYRFQRNVFPLHSISEMQNVEKYFPKFPYSKNYLQLATK